MAVVNNFDQWQKDTFFSAAEEVQNSADAMESMYRMWLRERNAGHHADAFAELRRELQTALGTAKWQLEEFERAVKESHGCRPIGMSSATRHNQFILAMAEQISQVERALGESLVQEGKEPLRWIQLDEEERNDLALFLSASPSSSKLAKTESATSSREIIPFGGVPELVVEEAAEETSRRRDDKPDQGESNSGAWKIDIADGERKERRQAETRADSPARAYGSINFPKVAELALKAKWFRNSLGKAKNTEDRSIEPATSPSFDLKGITRASQRTKGMAERAEGCLGDLKEGMISHLAEAQRHGPDHYMQLRRSVRITLLLALAMLLVVPFLLSTT